jgi:hypothetical protein
LAFADPARRAAGKFVDTWTIYVKLQKAGRATLVAFSNPSSFTI